MSERSSREGPQPSPSSLLKKEFRRGFRATSSQKEALGFFADAGDLLAKGAFLLISFTTTCLSPVNNHMEEWKKSNS